jgi:exosortase/archaeosortase family protein
LTLPVTWNTTAVVVSKFMDFGSIPHYYVNSIHVPTLFVKLQDGSIVGFLVLIECSGIIGVIIFTLLIAPTMGLLGGSLKFKLMWLLLSVGVGLLWNINRLTLVVTTAYYFGMGVFTFTHYILAPFIDFLWMVAMWSFGMSFLKRRRSETH